CKDAAALRTPDRFDLIVLAAAQAERGARTQLGVTPNASLAPKPFLPESRHHAGRILQTPLPVGVGRPMPDPVAAVVLYGQARLPGQRGRPKPAPYGLEIRLKRPHDGRQDQVFDPRRVHALAQDEAVADHLDRPVPTSLQHVLPYRPARLVPLPIQP